MTPSVRLYLSDGKAGHLEFRQTEDITITVRLPAYLVGVLVELEKTRARQSTWPADAIGWMSAQGIADAIDRSTPQGYLVQAGSVRKYIQRIEKLLRKHLANAPIQIVEHKHGLGYRLAFDLEIQS